MPGIFRSVTTTSGVTSRARSSACSPLCACETVKPACASHCAYSSRPARSSSTSSTLGFGSSWATDPLKPVYQRPRMSWPRGRCGRAGSPARALTRPDPTRPRLCGYLQHLSRLDLVRIAQLVAVRLEDFHVLIRAAEMLFGDRAERVSRLDRVSLSGLSSRRAGGGAATRDLDVGHDFVPPVRNRLDGVPDLVLVRLGLHAPAEVQLPVALLRAAIEAALRLLDGVRVLVSQAHV